MIQLKRRKPKWLKLGCGVRVLTKQLSYFRYMQLHQKMGDVIKDAQAVEATVKELSGGVLDPGSTPVADCLVMLACAQELIVDWSGVGDGEGGEAKATPQNIALFCENMATGPSWWSIVQSPIAELIKEGEGLADAPTGSSASSAEESAAHAGETMNHVSPQESGGMATPVQPTSIDPAPTSGE